MGSEGTGKQRAPRSRAKAAAGTRSRAGSRTTQPPRAPRATGRAAKASGARRAGRATPAPTTAPSGAEALVEQLSQLRVEVVFGIPGVHNLAIFEALRRSGIRTVLVRHEQTAVYAADGYARATGRLGVAVTTTGPGAANTAAAMGEARASRSPVLHISTQVETRILDGRSGRGSLHESPQQRELLDAVSVWSGTVMRAEAIPSMIQRAAAEATSGRRGPVFVEIPHDLLGKRCSWKPQPPLGRLRLAIDERALERAADVLAGAKRPVIWAGGGAIAAEAGEALLKLAEAVDAPIVTTYAGKGIVPPSHPLAVAFPPHQPQVTRLIEQSDAAVIVGSDLDAMNTQGWRIPFPRPRISINLLHEDARRNYAADVVIEHDAREALEALLGRIAPRRGGGAAKRVATARAAARKALEADEASAAPYAFVQQLEDVVDDGTVVVADMAVGGYWTAGYFRVAAPRSFQYPMGWGTLGYALPAAVGAAVAGAPRVLVVAGDAGLLFGVGELATLVQEDLAVTVLVVNDEGYGMLRYDERERFADTFAVDLHTPDLVALAKSFGLKAKRCEPDEVETTLRWAFKQKAPSLVEVRARFAPPVTTSPRWPLKGKPEARP